MNRRTLICSLDGVRPDGLRAARTPVIDRLIREGASAARARTVMPSCTLPCHTSMLRGVDTSRHGITTNTFQPLVRPVPSLLDVAHEQGLSVGVFYNWEELRDLASPGSLDVSVMYSDCNSEAGDRRIADCVVSHLHDFDLDMVFVYFGYPDLAGHHHGWMSRPYLDAVEHADCCLGAVLDELGRLGRAEATTTLVLSDHGGHDRTHGTDMDEDMRIPWILHGPGVRSAFIINREVRIYDTCTTLAHVAGLQSHPEWEGATVTEVLEPVD